MPTHDGTPGAPPPSRLTRHLALLDLHDEPLPEASLAAERRAMEELQPPRLSFPRVGRRGFWASVMPWSVAACAAACVALVVFWPREAPDRWQTMGGASAQVYVKAGGNVRPWSATAAYHAGDEFQAQVTAEDDTTAFLAVVNRRQELLTDVQKIWNNRLHIAPQEHVTFPGSLRLDADDAGEALVIVACPEAQTKSLTQDQLTSGVISLMTGKAPEPGVGSCHVFRFQLRQ